MMKVDVTWNRMKSPAVSDAGGFVLFFLVFLVCARIKCFFVRDLDLSRCSHRIFNISKHWAHSGSFTKEWTHFLQTSSCRHAWQCWNAAMQQIGFSSCVQRRNFQLLPTAGRLGVVLARHQSTSPRLSDFSLYKWLPILFWHESLSSILSMDI